MTLDEKCNGVDMRTFADIQKEYNLRDLSPIIYKYLKIIEYLHNYSPNESPEWYSEEALRKTKNEYERKANNYDNMRTNK